MFVVAITAGLILLAGIVVLARRQYTRPGVIRAYAASGEPADTRRVSKALRRGTPIPEHDHGIVQAVVDVQRRNVLSVAVIAVLITASGLLQLGSGRPERWVVLGCAVVIVGLAGWTFLTAKRMHGNAARLDIRPRGRAGASPTTR